MPPKGFVGDFTPPCRRSSELPSAHRLLERKDASPVVPHIDDRPALRSGEQRQAAPAPPTVHCSISRSPSELPNAAIGRRLINFWMAAGFSTLSLTYSISGSLVSVGWRGLRPNRRSSPGLRGGWQGLCEGKLHRLELTAFKYYYVPMGTRGLGGIVVKPTPDLLHLQQDLIDTSPRWPIERRKFSPHVTIGTAAFLDERQPSHSPPSPSPLCLPRSISSADDGTARKKLNAPSGERLMFTSNSVSSASERDTKIRGFCASRWPV